MARVQLNDDAYRNDMALPIPIDTSVLVTKDPQLLVVLE